MSGPLSTWTKLDKGYSLSLILYLDQHCLLDSILLLLFDITSSQLFSGKARRDGYGTPSSDFTSLTSWQP